MDSLIGFAATLGSVGIAVALWSINRQMDLERQLAQMQIRYEVALKAAAHNIELVSQQAKAAAHNIELVSQQAKAALAEAQDIRRLCEMEPGTYAEHVDPVTKRKSYVRTDDAANERDMFLNNQGDALDFLEEKIEQVMRR